MNGEAFAFFRWHCLKYPKVKDCGGIAERYSACHAEWRALRG